MYPDSNRLDPVIFDEMRDKVLRNFGEDDIASALDSDVIRAAIVAAGDNSWGKTEEGRAAVIHSNPATPWHSRAPHQRSQ